MSVRVFYDPDTVEQLAARGINGRSAATRGGFAITINGRRVLPDRRAIAAATGPKSALDLAEECERLRRDNLRLSSEITRLNAELDRLTAPSSRSAPDVDLDDAARRFSLIELDL